MQVLFFLALFEPTLTQYAISPYGYASSYNGYGTTSVLPYYSTGYTGYSIPYQYGYPYSGTTSVGYYPTYGYTGTLLGSGYGYPYGYPYTGTGAIGTGTIGTGTTGVIGTGTTGVVGTGTTGVIGAGTGSGVVVGDAGTGTVGVITGTAPVGTAVGAGTVVGAGITGLIGATATGLTALNANIIGTSIPGTFTIGDTLIVTGIAPTCCPPGLAAGQSVWSINLLSATLAPYVSLAVKTGWTVMTINSAVNGWTGGWYPANPPGQICPFQPNSAYSMQITNQATGLSFLINNRAYTYPNIAGGANVYAALGFVGYDKGQVCSITLVRGGVSSVLAVGTSPLCGTATVVG